MISILDNLKHLSHINDLAIFEAVAKGKDLLMYSEQLALIRFHIIHFQVGQLRKDDPADFILVRRSEKNSSCGNLIIMVKRLQKNGKNTDSDESNNGHH